MDMNFRAFDKKNSKIIYFNFGDIYGYEGEVNGVILPDEQTVLNYNSGFGYGGINEDLIFMQYTGFKDRNGKEIYEGDICTIWMGVKQDNPYIVEDLRELFLEMNHADSYYRITMIEVISNIYENPELISN